MAGEVKSLALTTAESTQTISTTLDELNEHVSAVVEIMSGMSAAIADIDVTTARAQTMTAEQATTLTALTEQVSAAIRRLDELTV